SSGDSSGPTDTTYQTTYTYSAQFPWERTAETTPSNGSSPGVGETTTWTWSAGTESAYGGGTVPKGLMLSKTMPAGGRWTYQYDAKGDLRVTTAPVREVTTDTYDAYGRVATQTNPGVLNAVTGTTHTERITNTYDANGNLVTVIDADTTGG